jgi:cobalt-zinc-cadmium efflux system protein
MGSAHHHPHLGDSHAHLSAVRSGEKARLLAVLLLTAVTMGAEFAGYAWTRSVALLGDAIHMLTHLLSLGISSGAVVLATRPSPPEQTWRAWRIEILAGLVNGLALLPAAAWVLYESWERFRNPVEIRPGATLLVGGIGLAVNLVCAALLHRHSHDDLNIRGAFFHMLADGLSSVGVLVAAAAVWLWNWTPADPLVAVLISLLLLGWCVSLVRSSTRILLEAAPPHVKLDEVRAALRTIPGVRDVHDLHVWTITSRMHSLSAHVELEGDPSVSAAEEIGRRIQALVDERWEINHATLQFETSRVEADCCPAGEGGGPKPEARAG